MAIPNLANKFKDALDQLQIQVKEYTALRIAQQERELALLKKLQRAGLDDVEYAVRLRDEAVVVAQTIELLGG